MSRPLNDHGMLATDERLGIGFRLEDLTAAIHAGLEIKVMGTAQFARILVLHIGWLLQRVGRATHATSRRPRLFPRYSHGKAPYSSRNGDSRRNRGLSVEAGLIVDGPPDG